jgi:S1-C subfamily serine protease
MKIARRSMLLWTMGALWTGVAQAGLPDVIARVKASVVLVGTYRATDAPRFRLRGTGFVVEDGLLVATNAHVLPDTVPGAEPPSLVVQVRRDGDWQMRTVRLEAMDAARDLAVLRILEGDPVPALKLGDSDRVREGDDLAFTGFPIGGVLGYSPVTHRAMVSSITPALLPTLSAERLQPGVIRGLRNGGFDIFQLDATAYPGNSGGPLYLPESGEVVGVMNMVVVKARRESALSDPSGIAYAVPVRLLRELLRRGR